MKAITAITTRPHKSVIKTYVNEIIIMFSFIIIQANQGESYTSLFGHMENLTFSSVDVEFVCSLKVEQRLNQRRTKWRSDTTCLRDMIRTMMMRLYFFIVIDTPFRRLDKNGFFIASLNSRFQSLIKTWVVCNPTNATSIKGKLQSQLTS